jgi:hypothetical protein
MKKIALATLAALTVMTPLQEAFAVSEAAVIWLLISPGSRPAGMGEAFVALADDASACWWNPAGLANVHSKDLRIMHTNWLPAFKMDDIFYDYIAYAQPVESLGGTVGGHIVYMNEGEQVQTDSGNNIVGTIHSREYAVGLSYGTLLNPDLSIGLGGKVIISDLAGGVTVGNQETGTGISFGFDMGMLWKTSIPFSSVPLNLGFNLSNFGPEISYADEKQADPLPTNLKFGTAINLWSDPHNEVTFVFDINKMLVHRTITETQLYTNDGSLLYWIDDEQQNTTTSATDENGDPLDLAIEVKNNSDTAFKALYSSWFAEGMEEELKKLVYNMGMEYWYRTDFNGSPGAFGIRSGYLHDSSGSIQSYTVGLSVLINIFAVDFSYEISKDKSNPSPRDKTMRFSLGLNF